MKDWNFEHMQRTIVRQHGIKIPELFSGSPAAIIKYA